MGPDQSVNIFNHLLIEALIISSPLLVAAALISVLVSLVQTLTSIQEQTLTAVPRLIVVFTVTVLMLPWATHRIAVYTIHLWTDLFRYLG